jgi:alpha,alpha-trehalase
VSPRRGASGFRGRARPGRAQHDGDQAGGDEDATASRAPRAPGRARAVTPPPSPPPTSSPFPPIADYGFLSDCHTGALVASDGAIEWMCLPHFDCPAVFAAMLDRGAGSFRVGPYGTYVPVGRRYIPGTNLIETTWMTAQGWLRVIDGLTIGEWHDNKHGSSHTRPPTDFDADHLLVRWVECVQGQIQVELVCEPLFAYGAVSARWTAVDTGEAGGFALDASPDPAVQEATAMARAREAGTGLPNAASDASQGADVARVPSDATPAGAAGEPASADRPPVRASGAYEGIELGFRLYSDLRMGVELGRVHARHTLVEGEQRFCAISWTEARGGPRTAAQAKQLLDDTSNFWRRWLGDGIYPDHPWRRQLQRSALALKGLTFMPTGALVAAPTSSLPETPGGSRNWDYRYCWMRDASFTLWALHALGLDWEADDFVEYVGELQRNDDGSLQIMYGIRGDRDLHESTLEHLDGYQGARPVRIGNGAYDQRQNDVYGAVLDSVYVHAKQRDHVPQGLWPVLIEQVHCAAQVWREPDQGIWEARGEPRHYVSSKLMCWVALDRGARLAERRGQQDAAERYQGIAEEIRADILTRGVDGRGVFRQHYDTDALDASNLLIGLLRFLPPDDERLRATVYAIKSELTENGLVLRYRTDETDDGQQGEEGTFLMCSFWLVSALSEIGEHREAEHLCERLLAYASPLGLYGEELEASSGRHLGNYPQAFTHLALINAVTHVVSAQQDR